MWSSFENINIDVQKGSSAFLRNSYSKLVIKERQLCKDVWTINSMNSINTIMPQKRNYKSTNTAAQVIIWQ